MWANLLEQLSQSFRIGFVAGLAAVGCCQLSSADDFRHAGRLGRAEPARLRFTDEAQPLNPEPDDSDLGTPPSDVEEEVSEAFSATQPSPQASPTQQSSAWRLRWRQPQGVTAANPTTVPSSTTVARPLESAKPKSKSVSASKAVLVWNDSQVSEPSHVRQVAQFSPADPFNDPFGDDSKNKSQNQPPAVLDTFEISQPAQPGSGAGVKPSTPGGGQPGGLNTSPFPGTQLQPNDPRLVPGGNRPIPPSNLPVPSKDSPFPFENRPTPADDRPTPGLDRPTLPFPPAPADAAPNLPDTTPESTEPAPQPKDSTEPMTPETPETPAQPNDTNGAAGDKAKTPCDRTYNERNCCTENSSCSEARQKIRAYTISRIHLDISPLFTNTDPNMTIEQMMARELAKAPSRTWLDRKGNQLAQGRIHDFRNGRVLVETDSGGIVKIPFNELSDDDLCFFTAWWSVPTECPLGDDPFIPRDWLCMNLDWKASGLCHKPLYFEEVALERYGHTTGPFTQPFVSTAHFFGSLVTLPYQMGMHPPQECQYVLGYYRPGSCAPWLFPPFPVSMRGGLAQAAAVVGGIYVIP